jgi:hypothetical protein
VEELQAYQYRLARAGRELEKQRVILEQRKAAASASSRRRAELSRQSGTSGDSHRAARNRGRSWLQHIPEGEREHLVQNLNMSFMSIDTRGNIIPKTPDQGKSLREEVGKMPQKCRLGIKDAVAHFIPIYFEERQGVEETVIVGIFKLKLLAHLPC